MQLMLMIIVCTLITPRIHPKKRKKHQITHYIDPTINTEGNTVEHVTTQDKEITTTEILTKTETGACWKTVFSEGLIGYEIASTCERNKRWL